MFVIKERIYIAMLNMFIVRYLDTQKNSTEFRQLDLYPSSGKMLGKPKVIL